jgi:hypothetical protein
MRGRIADIDRRHQTRIGRVGDVDNRGAEVFFVRDVADIGVVAGDGDLSSAGQIEMTQAPHITGERAVRTFNFHYYLSIVAPEAFTIAVHFGISAAI